MKNWYVSSKAALIASQGSGAGLGGVEGVVSFGGRPAFAPSGVSSNFRPSRPKRRRTQPSSSCWLTRSWNSGSIVACSSVNPWSMKNWYVSSKAALIASQGSGAGLGGVEGVVSFGGRPAFAPSGVSSNFRPPTPLEPAPRVSVLLTARITPTTTASFPLMLLIDTGCKRERANWREASKEDGK